MNGWKAALLAAGLTLGAGGGVQAAEAGLIRVDAAISPATAEYIGRALDVAAERGYSCLVIELDTPGGLLDSTKQIVQKFYSSPVPAVVYVAPSGASASSAGCFITLAASVAAMAPNTTIGAAHVVLMGPAGSEKLDDVMKEKLENFGSSYIQSIAEKRGRNVAWAISSVVKSESIVSEKALELNVIDLIAKDVPDLLRQLDGRKVDDNTIRTAGAGVVEIPMALRERLFQMLWRPEVLLLLMLAAIYGIIGELSSPGAILPGVVGAIALILALYMISVLPVNAAGLALIALAVILFIIDIFTPTHGVLTFGGIVSFFLGTLMLFNRSDPAFRLSLSYIVPATVVTALFFVFVVGKALRAQRLPVQAGRETMVGKTVTALARIDAGGGKVFVEGEYWNAASDRPVEPGQAAEIVAVDGLTLIVKPKNTGTG